MRPPRGLLLAAALLLLQPLGVARGRPTTTTGPGMAQCLGHSQNLLTTASNSLQKARQTLELYSCNSEEIDHEDITKDKTSTVETCLPLELTTNGSCLASGKASYMKAGHKMFLKHDGEEGGTKCSSPFCNVTQTLCLKNIYEDLKMYRMEFKAMNAKLLMDPKRQIILDQNMLAAIDELMQALNFNSETVPQKPPLEELDFYKTKVKLCILLHAFRVRAVTIHRMMSYLNSS